MPVISLRARQVPPSSARANLERALEALAEATEYQSVVLEDYKKALQSVGKAVKGLGSTFRGYETVLASVQREVIIVGDKARKLEQLMDRDWAA